MPSHTTYLNVNESFKNTIQGEGRQMGQVASFLRLAGCNLACSWCDTPYSWDWDNHDRQEESHKLPLDQVIEWIDEAPGRIIVTGGEPLLQARALAELITARPKRKWDLETNGTRPLGPTARLWSQISVSPKIGPSSNTPTGWAPTLGTFAYMARFCVEGAPAAVAHAASVDFKFVIVDSNDLNAVDQLVEDLSIPHERVWLMPEGVTPEVQVSRFKWVAMQALRRGYNMSSRLHVLAWPKERKR